MTDGPRGEARFVTARLTGSTMTVMLLAIRDEESVWISFLGANLDDNEAWTLVTPTEPEWLDSITWENE